MVRTRGACLMVLVVAAAAALAADGTIVYDGELLEAGVPANGSFDFRFRCFSGPDGDDHEQIGAVVEKDDVRVRQGRFEVELDFGPENHCTDSGWLETGVARSDRLGGFTLLEPLQSVSSASSRGNTENVPSGAVVFFLLAQCPDGWSEYVAARGRAIVGLPYGGTLGGTWGVPLSDLEQRFHQHQYNSMITTTSWGGQHNHIWSSIQNAGGDIQWTSYTAGGNPVLAFAWGNGIGNDGSGIYPMAAQPNATFYTTSGNNHRHDVFIDTGFTSLEASEMPFIQFLVCQKD